MKKKTLSIFLLFLFSYAVAGCAPLIIGGAVGALGGYAISKDTIQADTDIDYERLWSSAINLLRLRGTPKTEDYARGYISAEMESSKVWIRFIRLTRLSTRVRVSARKYHFPNLSLAQDLFVKIMEEPK